MQKLIGLIEEKYGSQAALARHLGWDRQKLNYFLTGQRIPLLKDIYAMSTALGVSLEWLTEIFLRQKSIKN